MTALRRWGCFAIVCAPSTMSAAEHSAPLEPPNPRASRPWLGFLFFLSGAVALVYEMLWYRQFNFLFGSAATASAAILAAYFAGLGIGSFVCGRFVQRWRRPWVAYAVLEIGIAGGALAVTPLLSLFSDAYSRYAAPGGASPEVLLFVKGLFGFAAIALPTVAMGGTLPVLAQWVDGLKEQPGRRIGWLYAVNTAGAALGALAFPFLLLPALGMRNTAFLCAAANIAIAAAALALGRRSSGADPGPAIPSVATRGGNLSAPLLLAFISGTGTFALQILWNRAFAQIHENSLSSFALIAAIFIIAIAIGAEFARLLLKRGLNMRKSLCALWTAGGVLVLLSPPIFLAASNQLEYLPSTGGTSRLLLLAATVILLPIALLSAGLPLLFHEVIRASDRSTGDRAGSLLAANIAGSIAGAMLAGFVLPKTLGLWNSAIAAGLLYLAAAACIGLQKLPPRLAAMASIAALGWILFSNQWPRTRLDPQSGDRLLAMAEGAHGIAAVTERTGSRRLKLNNHYVLGGTSAVGDERMQAHLPLLLHPAPNAAAFLGYGTGITAGGALFHPGVTATGIELVPEVGAFASRYFAEANNRFGANEASRLVIADARDFLRHSGAKFDVVIGDLVVPWRPGESSLYTREHFASAKLALNPGGLVCVWAPMFQVNEARFKIILNTFLAEFDLAMVWRGDFSPTEPALALIAFKTAAFSPQAAASRLAQMASDPFNPQLKFPTAFWMHLIGFVSRAQLDASEARLNTEDRPWLELPDSKAGEFFVGRGLQKWERQIREASRNQLTQTLPAEALRGWQAGESMLEFTLSLQEGRAAEAKSAEAQVRQWLGEEASRTVFGP